MDAETMMERQTLTAEQAVIAAVLLDSRVIRFATEECTPGDFEDARLGGIFRGVTGMVRDREPIDVISVSEKLREWDVRGIEAWELHAWIGELPTAQNVGHYAAQVRRAAVRRGATKIGIRLTQQATQRDPGWAIANAAEALRKLRDDTLVETLSAKPLREILQGEDDYEWVIPDLLERGDRLLLTGVEGGGKTTLVRQLAILSAAGIHPTSFYPIKPARVLVIDAENSEKQWRRAVRPMVELAGKRGEVDPGEALSISCMNRVDLTKDQDLGRIHKLVDDLKPDILFIGPLYRLIPRAINSDDDAAPLLAALDTIRERGLAMVIEAHAGHAIGAGGERDMRPRGSAALLGWPEFGLGLRVHKGAKGPSAQKEFQLVRWRGDRDERKWPFLIARDQESGFPWTPTYPGGTR